jgi:hypothetical protein
VRPDHPAIPIISRVALIALLGIAIVGVARTM